MAMKPDLPSIDDELVQPRPRPSFTNLRPRDDLTDSAIEANSRSIGQQWGASTRLPQPEEETPLASIRTDIPEYVDKQLKLKIVEEGGTKAYYILKGLSAIGFKVDGKDLRTRSPQAWAKVEKHFCTNVQKVDAYSVASSSGRTMGVLICSTWPLSRAVRPTLLRLSSFCTSPKSSADFLPHPITMPSIGARA